MISRKRCDDTSLHAEGINTTIRRPAKVTQRMIIGVNWRKESVP